MSVVFAWQWQHEVGKVTPKTYRAVIEGLSLALLEDDLDLSRVANVPALRDVLQQQRAQLLIGEPLQHTGAANQLRKSRPVRPHRGPRHGGQFTTESL